MTKLADEIERQRKQIIKAQFGGFHISIDEAAQIIAALRKSDALSHPSVPNGRSAGEAVAKSIMQERCVNVRCIACQRSLVGVQCCDSTCGEKGMACGLEPLLHAYATPPAADGMVLVPKRVMNLGPVYLEVELKEGERRINSRTLFEAIDHGLCKRPERVISATQPDESKGG